MFQKSINLLCVSLLFLSTSTNANEKNIFRKKPEGSPLISAHRSGGGIAPEETMKALNTAIDNPNFHADLIETDVHLTKDGQLVHLHDDTLDRTSNAVEYFHHVHVFAGSKTYQELSELNMGENFQNEVGEYPYRGLRGKDIPNDIRILHINDFLDYMNQLKHQYLLSIEIKDSFIPGFRAADILYENLKNRNMFDQTIVASFNQEVLWYIDYQYPEIIRSAGPLELIHFYLASLLNLPSLGNFKYKVIQAPFYPLPIIGFFGIGTKQFNDYAHKFNIATHYWTVNDINQIQYLEENGADSVITDYPDRAWNTFYNPAKFLNHYILYSLYTAPSQYAILAADQLSFNQHIENNIFSQLTTFYQSPTILKKKWSLFADYNTSYQKNSYSKNIHSHNHFSQYLNLGVIFQHISNIVIGSMLTINQSQRSQIKNFHYQQLLSHFSLFGYFPITQNLWLSSSIGIGKNKLTNITRESTFIYPEWIENGNSKANSIFANMSAGYHFNINDSVIITPFISFNDHHIKINGYQERNIYHIPNISIQYQNLKYNKKEAKSGMTISYHQDPIHLATTINYHHTISQKKVKISYRPSFISDYLHQYIPISNKNWVELNTRINIQLSSKVTLYSNLNITKAKSKKIESTFSAGLKWNLN